MKQKTSITAKEKKRSKIKKTEEKSEYTSWDFSPKDLDIEGYTGEECPIGGYGNPHNC